MNFIYNTFDKMGNFFDLIQKMNILNIINQWLMKSVFYVGNVTDLKSFGDTMGWEPELISCFVIGNLAIWISCLWISYNMLSVFFRLKEKDVSVTINHRWIILLLAITKFSNGMDHLIFSISIFRPYYYLQGAGLMVTALIYLTTARFISKVIVIEHISTEQK